MIGDGGIFTTINDIKKWDDAFYDSKVLSRKFWQQMTAEGELNNGEKTGYASGLVIEKYKGLNAISHGGAFAGFRAELIRFPEQKFTVAVFANRGDANPTTMAFKVADVFLKDDFKTESPVVDSAETNTATSTDEDIETPVTAAPLAYLVGDYQLEPGIKLKVSVQNETLHAYQVWNEKEYDFEPAANAANSFLIVGDSDFLFTFADFENNQAQVINLKRSSGSSAWNRVEEVDTSAVKLPDFVGDYYSQELDVLYQIKLKDDALTVHVGNNDPIPLKVSAIDQLSIQGMIADFSRQEDLITGFKLSAGRVKNLVFSKK